MNSPNLRFMESPTPNLAHWDHEPFREAGRNMGQKYCGIFFCPHFSASRFMERKRRPGTSCRAEVGELPFRISS